MRTFSSYGPVDKKRHFYVPRDNQIDKIYNQLVDGHYLTVWAPRQCGKTWLMNEVYHKICENKQYHALKLDLENLKHYDHTEKIIENISKRIIKKLKISIDETIHMGVFEFLFTKEVLTKPLILILDEFDSLDEKTISFIVSIFRNIYHTRLRDNTGAHENEYLLHGVALIGVRSVVGIEHVKGSPFNIQRSIRIPNLSFDETRKLFQCYVNETDHLINQDVIERIYRETCGQPGLVSWLGELITEGYDQYQPDYSKPITMKEFDEIYVDAIHLLPNNTILNILSKATQPPYTEFILELFNTKAAFPFRFDDKQTNFLYMNGVIDYSKKIENKAPTIKFSSPFVQKRLFNYFSYDYFKNIGDTVTPFEDLSHMITDVSIHMKNLIIRYENYLKKNQEWLFKQAPRRSDLKIYEAIYHFNLFVYLVNLFENYETVVWPEFPTGNGKVDILIKHSNKLYALEIKSFKDKPGFEKALKQASKYAKTLKLDVIYLVVFVESIDKKHRNMYEKKHHIPDQGIDIDVVFVDIAH